MRNTSTAYIKVKSTGKKYTFDGVVSIAHALTLKISTDSDSSTGSDYVNNARNEPDVVTLAVVASDVNSASQNQLRELAEIKEQRLICKVVTNLRTYKNMLLTDLSILQDETCPCGWSGTLTFTQTNQETAPGGNPNDNSSTPTSTGNTAAYQGSTGSTGSDSSASGGSNADGGHHAFSQIIHQAHILD